MQAEAATTPATVGLDEWAKYCEDTSATKRRATRTVWAGKVPIGSEHRIARQTMTTTNTNDVEATVEQVLCTQCTGDSTAFPCNVDNALSNRATALGGLVRRDRVTWRSLSTDAIPSTVARLARGIISQLYFHSAPVAVARKM